MNVLEPRIMLFTTIQVMLSKKNQRIDSTEFNKICIIHFPSSNKTLSICFKQLIRIKNLKRLNNLHLNILINRTDPLRSFLNKVPILPRHHWLRDSYQRFTKNLDCRYKINRIKVRVQGVWTT